MRSAFANNSVGNIVAIKIIRKASSWHDGSSENFKKEIEIMKKLGDSQESNVISVIDCIETEKWIYIVLE